MYSVGDVARLAGISVRMLRHYDEIGLLPPARVDARSGYRVYEPDQVARLHRILALKDLGFTLAQIATIVDDAVSAEQLRGMLRLRRAELADDIARSEQRLRRVDHHIRLIDLERTMSTPSVTVKRIEPATVACVSTVVEGFGEPVTQAMPPLYPALFERLALAGVAWSGLPLALYDDTDDEFVRASAAVVVADGVTGIEGVELRALPLVEQAATLVHRGPMSECEASYARLLQWIAANGLRAVGHGREVYHDCPDDPAAWVTELQFSVVPA